MRPLDALRRRTHLSGGQFKYIFQIKYTAAVLSNSTRKLLWFKITKMLIAVKKLIYCVICCNFAVTRSFPTVSCSPSVCVWSYDSGVSVRVCVCVESWLLSCRTRASTCAWRTTLSAGFSSAPSSLSRVTHTPTHTSRTLLYCPVNGSGVQQGAVLSPVLSCLYIIIIIVIVIIIYSLKIGAGQ